MKVCAGPDCLDEFDPVVHNQKYCGPVCKRAAENTARRKAFTEDVAQAVVNSVAPAYLSLEDEEERVDFLQKEVLRLSRLADKRKSIKTEIVDLTYQAAFDAFSDFELPAIPKPVHKKSGPGEEEVAVAICADWQLGKVTPSYNSNVCRDRIDIFADKILSITEMQRADHPVNDIHLWLMGDIVEGEEIFAGQSHLLDSGIYRQVGVNGPEILSDLILKLLTGFENVHVVGVIGNHGSVGGRGRRDYNGETNMDRLLYKIVSYIFKDEPRVTFNIPDGHGERNFYAIDSIGDYSTLLIHGDQFPAPTATHAYYKKVMGWKDGAIPETFQDVYMGHYHQNAKMTLGNTILRISGSPESYNTYAQEVLAAMGRPSQPLQFVHPINGITGEYTVWLD